MSDGAVPERSKTGLGRGPRAVAVEAAGIVCESPFPRLCCRAVRACGLSALACVWPLVLLKDVSGLLSPPF